jgi:hypothetical protein
MLRKIAVLDEPLQIGWLRHPRLFGHHLEFNQLATDRSVDTLREFFTQRSMKKRAGPP